MYCKNCGNTMDDLATICVKCGVQKGVGNKYCHNCGKETDSDAAFCMSCGCAIANVSKTNEPKEATGSKSKIAAGLLGIFLGVFGVHNFYLGYTNKAIAQLLISVLSCGIFAVASAIWGLIEGILILTGSMNKDANGNPLV
ncbi:TM2 domain-containing protein [uncultured Ruminococcus sp.]|uniref:TM2 domain-containing protein n=1 Tax=uncultured Ruminococcus sp. TaxID=165186 RepID=UPI0025FE5644|nr:TM2 domain-containing protein [uncultured Ruminococcus sp.]